MPVLILVDQCFPHLRFNAIVLEAFDYISGIRNC